MNLSDVIVGKYNDHAWGLRRRISLGGTWIEQDVRGVVYMPQMPISPNQINDLTLCLYRALELIRSID
jgi:hypothetical protein